MNYFVNIPLGLYSYNPPHNKLKSGLGSLFLWNKLTGAGDGIRTRTNSLEGYCASR